VIAAEGEAYMDHRFVEAVEASPIIAAIKDAEGLELCLESESQVVFILYGDVCNIGEIVGRIKDSGRIALVHMDLITGLSTKEVAVDFIHQNTEADGIISTKPALVKRAAELEMYTVMRFFVLDSMSLSNIENQWKHVKPDFIEILPGVMPKIIRRIKQMVEVPVIAGGLISDKEDIIAALDAGATSVSATDPKVWFL